MLPLLFPTAGATTVDLPLRLDACSFSSLPLLPDRFLRRSGGGGGDLPLAAVSSLSLSSSTSTTNMPKVGL